ncbi:cytochrome P450 4C1-like [Plutella xylostella]|uniref:cytochrome P450 4C1-like n=1 Tax=Plutella xylostella TaxID=51655 RepID=UPI002032832A|nr:cytochrome P450 4C1-like [Plutella xylostella]
MYLVLLCCLLLLPALLYWCLRVRTRRARRLVAALPGWPQVPFFGNALRLWGGPEAIFKCVQEIGDLADEANCMFQIWFGSQLVLVSHKPEEIKTLTNTFIEKPYYYSFGKIWLGDGLVTGPGSVWKHNVKNLSATFTGSVIDGFQDIFNQQARRLVDQLSGEAGRPPFDAMQKYFAYATLETICQTAMGVPAISDSIVTSEYYQAFNRTLQLIVERGFNIFLHPDCVYRLTPGYRELKKNVAVLHHVSTTVIAQSRMRYNEAKKNGQLNNNNTNGAKSTRFRPFLDILMELSESDPLLTDEQIRAEVDTVIVGGQETTATNMLFTLLMLGCHKEVQDKLFKEMQEIFGDSNRPVEKEDLAKMKYCEAVVLESLRLFPPIPGTLRLAEVDTPMDGFTVPAGSVFVVNALGAGRSLRTYGPDARQFRPERWLENPPANPASFLAFSYGRRACIGKRYALAFLKTALSHISRALVVHSEAQHLKLAYSLALRPSAGHLITVDLRK